MNLKHYYLFLAIVLVLGLGYQIIPKLIPAGSSHYIGCNITIVNSTCKITWMGGEDYHSFFDDVKMDNISLGHISEGTIIYNGPCKNISVYAYNKPVHSYVLVYHYP